MEEEIVELKKNARLVIEVKDQEVWTKPVTIELQDEGVSTLKS